MHHFHSPSAGLHKTDLLASGEMGSLCFCEAFTYKLVFPSHCNIARSLLSSRQIFRTNNVAISHADRCFLVLNCDFALGAAFLSAQRHSCLRVRVIQQNILRESSTSMQAAHSALFNSQSASRLRNGYKDLQSI